MQAIEKVEAAASALDAASRELMMVHDDYTQALASFEKNWTPQIQSARRKYNFAHEELAYLVESNPELFTKPRSMTRGIVKFGLQKESQFNRPADAELETLLKEHIPAMLDFLMPATRSVNLQALKLLSTEQLKTLKCEKKDSDQLLLKTGADSDYKQTQNFGG